MVSNRVASCSWIVDAQSKSATAQQSETPASSSAKSPAGRSRGPIRRVAAHTTRLEPLDDSLGPLGPLGDNAAQATSPAEQPPVPPSKEQTVTLNVRQPDASQRVRDIMDPDYDDEPQPSGKPRAPPPVQPAHGSPVRRDIQPSVSIEQAAKPSFDITVGDPHKVGDLTSSHIEYQVRTKVQSGLIELANRTDRETT